MNNLPPLGKATAAFDEQLQVDEDGEVDGGDEDEEVGSDQYDEREACTPSPVMCTMCQIYFYNRN